MRAAAGDAERLAERGEPVARQREGAARERERVEVVRDPARAPGAGELGLEERDVPRGGVRDEDGALEHRLEARRDLGERGRGRDLGGIDAVDVRVAEGAALGPDERRERVLHAPAAHALDADLEHAVVAGREAGHLEIDEAERRLGEGLVPGRARGRLAGCPGIRARAPPLDRARDRAAPGVACRP